MRSATSVLLVAALLVPPAAGLLGGDAPAYADVTVRPEPRGSIVIEGDDELENHSAVRGGSGRAEDPYVISDYFVQDGPEHDSAIKLVNTTSHVRIEDLVARGGAHTIRLDEASNVTLEDIQLYGTGVGLSILGSQDASVDRLRVGPPRSEASHGFVERDTGLEVVSSRDVQVTNLTITGRDQVFLITNSHGVTLRSASLLGTTMRTDFANFDANENLTLDLLDVDDVRLRWVPNPSLNFSLRRSTLSSSPIGGGALHPVVRGLSICGNTFRGFEANALEFEGDRDGEVVGNLFTDGTKGLLATDSEGTTLAWNRFHNLSSHAGEVDVRGAELHHNRFEDLGPILESYTLAQRGVVVETEANATRNWWGHPTGPSGVGNGSGEQLLTFGANVTYDPWLREPPATGPDAVDCGVPQGPPGAKATPEVGLSVSASAQIES